MLTHLAFAAFVGLGVYAQNVTGFALALILLCLVGVTDLVPLPDAANVATVILIVNAMMFFYRRRSARIERAIVPAVAASLVGALIGMALLAFLAANAYHVLKLILGGSIVVSALMLWRAAAALRTTSGPGYFAFVGTLSGLLGGMFSAPGPPLVYAVYRQPWSIERMQESLIFSFAVGALLRLIVMLFTGNFSELSMLLTLEAIPVALVVTALSATHRPPVSARTLKLIVCLLLVGSGTGMLWASLRVMMG